MSVRTKELLFLSFLLVLLRPALAENWLQFRGPNGSGISSEKATSPKQTGQKTLWRTALPAGHSSPIVVGNRVLLTAFENDDLLTICVDPLTGHVLWRHATRRRHSGSYHKMNSAATPSPVSDGKNVYVFFGDYGLVALSLDGQPHWTLPLGPFDNSNGMGSSPILAGNKLLVLCDQNVGSFFLAVDKTTGRQEWRAERPGYTNGYSTPIRYKPDRGALQAIVAGSVRLTAYDVETGREVWWVRGLPWQMKSTPVIDKAHLYIHGVAGDGQWPEAPTYEQILQRLDGDQDGKLSKAESDSDPLVRKWWGTLDVNADGRVDAREWKIFQERGLSRNAVFGFRLGGKGDMTDTNLLWRYDKAVPAVPSPLLYRNVLYVLKEGGILTTLDPGTGKVLKQSRLEGAPGEYFASPIVGSGQIYLLSHEGKLIVLQPGGEWKILSINDLAEECWATPAFSDQCLFVRTSKALHCLSIRAQ
jgi:outer membrane protein assembly factor BamB